MPYLHFKTVTIMLAIDEAPTVVSNRGALSGADWCLGFHYSE